MAKFSFNDSGRMRYSIITERFLTSVLKILVSDTEVQKRSINNLIKLFNSLDLRYYYDRDITVGTLIKVIELIIGNRLINKNNIDVDNFILEIESLVSNENNGDCINNLIIPTLLNAKGNIYPHDLEIMNTGLDIQLKYGKIIMMADDLTQVFNALRTSTGADLIEALGNMRSLFSNALEYFRETDTQIGVNNIIHTSDPEFMDTMIETYQKMTNPASVLRTGLQLYNKLLSVRGGFEGGKFYMIYAKINSFKSALLEQITRMIQQYNSEIFIEDYKKSGRRPTILMVSLENSLVEDNSRLFKMYTEYDIEVMKNIDEMRNIWLKHYSKTDSFIDISMYHGDAGSVKVSDIKNMIDTLNDEGYKVIALVLDYFELLKAEEDYARLEVRMQHTKNGDGLLNIAKTYDIPVITAHQLNRVGDATLMNAKDSGAMNVVQLMNNQFIGESFGIEKSVSHSTFINIEKNPFDGKVYLTVKSNKNRSKQSDVDYFVHEIKDGIYLEDDIDLPEPLSKRAITVDNGNELDFHVDTNEGKRGVKDPTRHKIAPKVNQENELYQKPKTTFTDVINAMHKANKIISIFAKGFDEYGYTNLVSRDFKVLCDGYIYNEEDIKELDFYRS